MRHQDRLLQLHARPRLDALEPRVRASRRLHLPRVQRVRARRLRHVLPEAPGRREGVRQEDARPRHAPLEEAFPEGEEARRRLGSLRAPRNGRRSFARGVPRPAQDLRGHRRQEAPREHVLVPQRDIACPRGDRRRHVHPPRRPAAPDLRAPAHPLECEGHRGDVQEVPLEACRPHALHRLAWRRSEERRRRDHEEVRQARVLLPLPQPRVHRRQDLPRVAVPSMRADEHPEAL